MTNDSRGVLPSTSTFASARPAGAGWGWILAYGILSVLLGIAAFVWPIPATFAATLVIGAFFIAAGAVSIGAGVFGRGHEGRGYQIALGVLSVGVGALLAFEPATGALSLTLLVAIWLAVRGVMELGFGFRMRRAKAAMIGLGIIDVFLAIIVLATLPFSALTLPGFILGISFAFGGIAAISSALHHRSGEPPFAVG